MCVLLGREDLLTDPRFLTNSDRTEHATELGEILDRAFGRDTTDNWLAKLDEAGIPNAPINTVDRVVADPHVAAREMIVEVEHPTAGRLRMPGVPVKMLATPGSVDRPAPLLGADTAAVLQEMLGWDAAKAARFAEQ